MLDTNVFNDVLDGKISSESFAGRRVLVIGVQADELRAAASTERRAALLGVFEEVKPTERFAKHRWLA
jgi:CHASE2 domain-containing sensor protein